MVSLADRLREERERLGLSQDALAAGTDQSRKTQIRYESGERTPDANYLTAAAKQGVDIFYVLTGQRTNLGPIYALSAMFEKKYGLALEMARKADEIEASSPTIRITPQYVPVPMHDAFLAAGDGHLNDTDAVTGHVAFRREWLTGIGVSPGAAVIATAAGDSMEPTIHSGDMLLIDLARSSVPARVRDERDTRPSGIYAVLDDGAARVKRVELAVPGTLALLSDNPAFPPEFRAADSVSIIGRVVWWGHTSGD